LVFQLSHKRGFLNALIKRTPPPQSKSFKPVATTKVLKSTQKTEGTAQHVNISHYQYL
jgi:hypothetical protein